MCGKAADSFLPTLKFIPGWFVPSEMINMIFSNDGIIFVTEDSNYITFFSDETGFLSVDCNIINLNPNKARLFEGNFPGGGQFTLSLCISRRTYLKSI